MQMMAAAYVDRETHMAALVYDGSTPDKSWLWNASYQYSMDRYESVSQATKPSTNQPYDFQYYMGNKIETNQVRGSLTHTTDLFDITAGADFMQYKTWNSGSPSGNGRTQYGPDYYGTPLHLGHTSRTYGLSLLGTLKLFDNKVNITGGLRYDYTRVKDNCVGDEPWWHNRKNNLYGDNRFGNMPTSRTFKHLSPGIGITYLPFEWLKLRANYTQGFRPPGGRQLFSSDATEGYGAPGYPLLKAEYSDNYEAGFDLQFTDINFSFTYFFSKFKNHIAIRTYQPSNAGVGVTAWNADERKQAGLELSGSANVAGLLGFTSFEVRPYFSLTYMTQMEELVTRGQDFRYLGSRFGQWTDITGIPELTASWGVSFRHKEFGTAANLNFYYFGEAKVSGSAGPNSGVPSIGTYGKFTIANLSLSQRLFAYENYGDLTLKVHVNNLFNETYNYNSSGMAKTSPWYPGRNFYVGLALNF